MATGTWAGRLILGGTAAKILAALVRSPSGREPMLVSAVDVLGSLALVAAAFLMLYRLQQRARRRLLWRVRRKLILSYVFMGVVPALLIVSFFLVAGADPLPERRVVPGAEWPRQRHERRVEPRARDGARGAAHAGRRGRRADPPATPAGAVGALPRRVDRPGLRGRPRLRPRRERRHDVGRAAPPADRDTAVAGRSRRGSGAGPGPGRRQGRAAGREAAAAAARRSLGARGSARGAARLDQLPRVRGAARAAAAPRRDGGSRRAARRRLRPRSEACLRRRRRRAQERRARAAPAREHQHQDRRPGAGVRARVQHVDGRDAGIDRRPGAERRRDGWHGQAALPLDCLARVHATGPPGVPTRRR